MSPAASSSSSLSLPTHPYSLTRSLSRSPSPTPISTSSTSYFPQAPLSSSPPSSLLPSPLSLNSPLNSPSHSRRSSSGPSGLGGLNRWKGKGRAVIQDNLGLCFITASQALFACMNVSVKILQDRGAGKPMGVLELIFIRMSFTLLGCVAWLQHIGDPNPILGPPDVRALLALRGFIGFFGLSGMYSSLRYLSLSDATTISFLSPTATAVLGYMVLKERFEGKEAIAGLISLIGVILIAKPAFLFGSPTVSPPDPALALAISEGLSRTSFLTPAVDAFEPTAGQRLGAVGFALMGVAGSAGAYTAIRAIGKRATPYHSIGYFSFYCVVVSFFGMIYFKSTIVIPTTLRGWGLIVIIGIFGLGAQVFLTMGLQREKAGRGALAMYTQLLFAAILEKLVFGRTPSLLSVTGTFIILSAAIWVATSKREPVKPHPDDEESYQPLPTSENPSTPELPGAGRAQSYAMVARSPGGSVASGVEGRERGVSLSSVRSLGAGEGAKGKGKGMNRKPSWSSGGDRIEEKD